MFGPRLQTSGTRFEAHSLQETVDLKEKGIPGNRDEQIPGETQDAQSLPLADNWISCTRPEAWERCNPPDPDNDTGPISW